MNTIKSKQRVADHGEVFTPAWLVEAMAGCTTLWWRGSEVRLGEPVGWPVAPDGPPLDLNVSQSGALVVMVV